MTANAAIRLTPDARSWALEKGGAITLRPSRRAGCCGGGAMIPVAEIGAPSDPSSHHRQMVDGVSVYTAPNLGMNERRSITIDMVRFLRWKRLVVEGVDIETVRADRN